MEIVAMAALCTAAFWLVALPRAARGSETADAAKRGYRFLVNGSYVGCGVPVEALRRLDPFLRALPFFARETLSPFPDIFVPTPELPEREGPNRELKYYLNAFQSPSGPVVASPNCLFCHAKVLNGKLVVGLGSTSRNFTLDVPLNVRMLRSALATAGERTEFERYASRVLAVAPFVKTATLGTNSADSAQFAYFAHRDPETQQWSSTALLPLPPTPVPPADVPPWWNVKRKSALFYNGWWKGRHSRMMMLESVICTDTRKDLEALDGPFEDVEAFLSTLEPPRFPHPVDHALARTGASVFEQRCAHCHGEHRGDAEENTRQGNRFVGLAQIGTDPALAHVLSLPQFMEWTQSSHYGQGAAYGPNLGYVAPPLTGVWATAPYLHNGSVPTLAALLHSPSRPRHWIRSTDYDGYDFQQVGLVFSRSPHGQEGEWNPLRKNRIYDTTLPGHAHSGHLYGDRLSAAERTALLEYLKTL